MDLVFDIETDGLEATKVWCLVAQDAETGRLSELTNEDIEFDNSGDEGF